MDPTHESDENWLLKVKKAAAKEAPESSEAIDQLERIIGRQLPSDYRQYLEAVGRCIFRDDALVKAKSGKMEVISKMYGIQGRGGVLEDLEWHPDYLERNIVPIADDVYGNRFVLDFRHGSSVKFLEYVNGRGESVEPNLIDVAENFFSFIRMITFEPV